MMNYEIGSEVLAKLEIEARENHEAKKAAIQEMVRTHFGGDISEMLHSVSDILCDDSDKISEILPMSRDARKLHGMGMSLYRTAIALARFGR